MAGGTKTPQDDWTMNNIILFGQFYYWHLQYSVIYMYNISGGKITFFSIQYYVHLSQI